MTGSPLIVFSDVSKQYGGELPLRFTRLAVHAGDRLVMGGLDRSAAESVIHLISGAALPDHGTVQVAGVDTRQIATDTEWLLSLDRFGIVTHRAVLLGTLSTAANLALPITVAIDPLSDETRAAVDALADEVELPRTRLNVPCGALTPVDTLRLHLARALATGPQFLLIEHPTMDLADAAARTAFGDVLRRVADRRQLGWLALSNDRDFVRASGGTRWHLDASSGIVKRESWWKRF
jgi:ABC-type ATPase involved in cell division